MSEILKWKHSISREEDEDPVLNILEEEEEGQVPITMVFSHLVNDGKEEEEEPKEEEEEEEKTKREEKKKKSPPKKIVKKSPQKRLSIGSEDDNLDDLLELEDE